jgi:hypothetical protein
MCLYSGGQGYWGSARWAFIPALHAHFSVLFTLLNTHDFNIQLLTITTPSKHEAHTFFSKRLLPSVPLSLREPLLAEFDALFGALGGRIEHWETYISEFVRAGGGLSGTFPFLARTKYKSGTLIFSLIPSFGLHTDSGEIDPIHKRTRSPPPYPTARLRSRTRRARTGRNPGTRTA